MAQEIERKFLVDPSKLSNLEDGALIRQSNIPTENGSTVRIRIKGLKAYITIKSKKEGFSRLEFEYEIPMDDAQEMLRKFCPMQPIEKVRYVLEYGEHHWEIDFFNGDNYGLIVAEVELQSEEEAFEMPPWVTKEVTGDKKYSNSNLMKRPFKYW